MVKIKFNLLQILTMSSLNVKHQGKAPIIWHFKSDISEAYKVQIDCLKIHSLILMINVI